MPRYATAAEVTAVRTGQVRTAAPSPLSPGRNAHLSARVKGR